MLSMVESLALVVSYFVALRMLIQHSGIEYAGLWSLTMGFVTLIRILDLTGAAGLARMVALADGNNRLAAEYIDTLGTIVFAAYTALVLITYLPLHSFFSTFLEIDIREEGLTLFLIAMIALPINLVGSAHLSALDGIGRADLRAILNTGAIILFLLLTWALLPHYGIEGMAFAQILQFIVGLIAARLFLAKSVSALSVLPRAFSKFAARETLSFGAKLQLSSIPMALFDPLSRIMLGRIAGLEFLAQYDIAYKIAGYTRNLVRAYLSPMLPEFSRLVTTDVKAARHLLSETSVAMARLVSVLFTGLILISPLFSLFMFSRMSAEFLLFTAALSLGWGLTTFGVITQLYARAANVLRWSILGQWGMLALCVPIIAATDAYLDDVFLPIVLAFIVFIGHTFAFVGEVRTLQLSPFPSKRSLVPWVGTFVAVCVAMITLMLMRIEF